MHGGPLDIDAIVREVVARLAAAAPATVGASSSIASLSLASTAAPPAVSPAVSADVSLLGTVVTVDLLTRQVPADARRVLVAPRAVVTPAARDWLRARSLELVRNATATSASNSPSAAAATQPRSLGKFYLHATLPGAAKQEWTQRIVAAGWDLETLVPCSARQAAAELAAVLGPANRLGLLLTRETTLAVCQANRHDNVRAAEAGDVDSVRAAVKQIHANLLVVDPTRRGQFALKQMTQEFLRVGPREAPASWRGDS